MGDPNPYYNDPAFAAIASNLSRAFVDKNPGQTMVNREHAGVLRLQGSKLQRELDKRSAIANTFRNLKGRPPTPEEVASLTADSIEGGVKPGDLAESTLYHASNSGQDDSAIGRAFVGTGKTIGKNDGVSLGDREKVAARDDSAAMARTSTSAGIAAGASRANNADMIRAQNDRHAADLDFKGKTRFDAPVHITPGSGLLFNPDDPRPPTGYKPGEVTVPVPAKPSRDHYVESEDPENPGKNVYTTAKDGLPGKARPAGERYVQSTDPVTGETTYQPVSPGLPGKADRPPADRYVKTVDATGKTVYALAREGLEAPPAADRFVPSTDANGVTTYQPVAPGLPARADKPVRDPAATAKAIHDIELQALTDADAVEFNDNGVPIAMKDEFRQLHRANLPAAKQALAAELQATNDGARAAAAYNRVLGIKPGMTFKPKGTPIIGSGPAAMVGGDSAPPRAGGNPAAAATVSDSLPPQAAASLKEGAETTFGNGQVWTKQNGAPVRVR